MATSYRPGFSDVALSSDVKDVGLSSEPDLELLSEIKPDLFISGWQTDAMELLRRIAPVLSLNLYTGQTNAYLALHDALRVIAHAIGRETEALNAIAATDATIAACRLRLRASGQFPRLYLTDLGFGGGRVGICGMHSLGHAVLSRLGLENAWKGTDERWGVAAVDLVRLAEDPAATIVRLQQYGADSLSTERQLMQTALWKALPAVKAGRVVSLPPTDFFGGLQTAMRLAMLLTDALLKDAR